MTSRYSTDNLTRVSELTPYEWTPPDTWEAERLDGFVTALQKECPHFQFGEKGRGLFVYVDDETYTRGWIGYRNFYDTGGEEKYGVWSKGIINEKYGTYNYQHNMRMSKILKSAVKVAKGYMNRVTSANINEAYHHIVDSAVDSKAYSYKNEISSKTTALGIGYQDMGKRVMRELISLYDSGYEFLDTEIPQKIQELKDAISEHADNTANKQAVLVWKDGSKVRTTGVNLSEVYWKAVTDEKVYATPEMLPPEVLSKISILQVAEDEAYLMDTGMRFGEDIFYVQV